MHPITGDFFVWTVCKGDWVSEQPPPSRPLTAALGSIPLQASWVLQNSPAPLKKRIKKEKLYLCVVEGPLFSFWTSLRSYHYFPVPFPCFEDCMSLSFQSKLSFLLAPCFGVILQTCIRYLLLLSEGNCSLLCPWTSALPLSLLLKEWCLFTWYMTQSLYLFPQLFIPFFCMS